ncbi:MAG: hypothetical protein CMJ78_14140 [Planctomycetaceae bacterium]|nr:hypothetical protein [Planctomycetaceae bacterium]
MKSLAALTLLAIFGAARDAATSAQRSPDFSKSRASDLCSSESFSCRYLGRMLAHNQVNLPLQTIEATHE